MAKRAKRRVGATKIGTGSIVTDRVLKDEHVRLFERVAEEVLYNDRVLFDKLSEAERALVVEWLAESIVDGRAETMLHDLLWEIDYIRKPPSIEEFVENEYYFGHSAAFLHPRWKEDLFEVFKPGSVIFEWIFTGAIGTGKGHPIDERVLTPDGWCRVGDVRVGSSLVGKDGMPTKVSGVFPRGVLPTYRVTFNDGASVVVDGDHLWSVQSPSAHARGNAWKTITTKDLIGTIVNARGQRRWHIPVVHPVWFEPQDLQLHPYALGALIGDGGLTQGSIRFSTVDAQILEDVAVACGLRANHIGGCDYRLVWEEDHTNPVLARLRDLGVCVRSERKRIPATYLRGSVRQRLDLLRGLMDTDGWLENEGRSSMFSSASEGLADDLVELVRSLGGIARKTRKETTHLPAHQVAIRLDACPFQVHRKASRWVAPSKYHAARLIDSIELEGSAEVVCLQVEAEDSLYVAEDYVVTHNTTVGDIALGKKLCDLSCLRDPSRYYGLLPDEKIAFGIYATTLAQAADAGYFKLRGYIDNSPYFREHFQRDLGRDSRIDFEPNTGRKIQVVQGSRSGHALGIDLFAFLMDEANFMEEKQDKVTGKTVGQAYELYNATYTRLQSRFGRAGGMLPGMMILISSRNSQTSFLEEHLKSTMAGDFAANTFVSDYPLWACKPKHKYTFPGFFVEIGDRTSKSRILKADEKPRKSARVIEIPTELRKMFNEDVDQALRDAAGVATFNTSPLIRDRASVFDAAHPKMKHPFTLETVICDIDDETLIEAHFVAKQLVRVKGSKHLPRLNSKCPRFIHVDIGLTGDALGFAMGHVAGKVRTERVSAEGLLSTVINPYIVMDLMLRVQAPPGGEIDLSKVRAFILFLKRIFPIAKITFDQFQSSDSIQILKKEHLDAGHQSVDKKEDAYLSLRSALFDRRIAMYAYEPFQDEVLDLERDMKKRKVDHPTKATKGGKGSKDVSDAVAGVVSLCMNDDRALHESVADLEITPRALLAQTKRGAADPIPPDRSGEKLGAARKSWDDLRSNV